MEKATFLQRLAAFAIDFVIVTAVFIGFSILGGTISDLILTDETSNWMEFSTAFYLIAQLLNVAFMLAYFIIPWVVSGQTLGNLIMKIRVVKRDGAKLSWESAILRWVGYIIGSFLFWLGFLWMLFDKDKECWHDRMAGSTVVKA